MWALGHFTLTHHSGKPQGLTMLAMPSQTIGSCLAEYHHRGHLFIFFSVFFFFLFLLFLLGCNHWYITLTFAFSCLSSFWITTSHFFQTVTKCTISPTLITHKMCLRSVFFKPLTVSEAVMLARRDPTVTCFCSPWNTCCKALKEKKKKTCWGFNRNIGALLCICRDLLQSVSLTFSFHMRNTWAVGDEPQSS